MSDDWAIKEINQLIPVQPEQGWRVILADVGSCEEDKTYWESKPIVCWCLCRDDTEHEEQHVVPMIVGEDNKSLMSCHYMCSFVMIANEDTDVNDIKRELKNFWEELDRFRAEYKKQRQNTSCCL